MKTLKNITLTFLVAITAFATTTYVACNKDKCKGVVCKTGEVCTNGICRDTRCDNMVCQNDGQCVKGVCKCIPGYLGDNCEILFGKKFLGSYTATEECSGNPKTYIINITTRTSGSVEFRLDNLGNYTIDIAIEIKPDENSFTFYSAKDGYEFAGAGAYNNGNIDISYTIVPLGLSPIYCTGTWVRNN